MAALGLDLTACTCTGHALGQDLKVHSGVTYFVLSVRYNLHQTSPNVITVHMKYAPMASMMLYDDTVQKLGLLNTHIIGKIHQLCKK